MATDSEFTDDCYHAVSFARDSFEARHRGSVQMLDDPGIPETVLVVDPDDRLTRVTEALQRGGIDDVRTVDSVETIETDAESIGCVLVPHGPDTFNGIAVMDDVRDRLGDVPVGVYALDGDRGTVVRLLEAGADTVFRVPPERETVLAARVRHLAGVAGTEPIDQQFESLLEHYPEVVYLKDTDGQFINVTQSTFSGDEGPDLDREQVRGLTDYELYDRELADALFEEEQELLSRAEAVEGRIEHYVEGGEGRWISTTKVPWYDADGELLGLVGNVRDVTSIKRQGRMMAMLHDASRRLVRAESKAEIGRVAVDIATEIDALPWARVDLFDPETGALETVATVEDVAWDDQSFQRVAATRESKYRTTTGEFVAVEDVEHEELKLPDGIEGAGGLRLPLGEHGVIGLDAGDRTLDPFTIELAHVLAANVEAALDRAEQERRLMAQSERLEEFAALSSHELRNRLQVALGTAERARAEEDITAVDDVIDALGRMDRLVGQLLTLARTGSVSHSTESLALSGIVDTAWHAVGMDGVTLSIADDAIVTADRDALLEVFEMLFRTVLESDSEHVRAGTLSDGFYLEDDASTVDPADLFEPTYSDGETSGDSAYLVSVIANAHSWTIDVEPRDGGGTRLSFRKVDIAHVE